MRTYRAAGQPKTYQLSDLTLLQVKQAQEVIMKDQDQSIGQQKESNVLLGKVIATIEQTNDIMGESQENKHILTN